MRTGLTGTACQPGELITAVRVPCRAGVGWGYQKFVRRSHDWAIVGIAATARPDRACQCAHRPGARAAGMKEVEARWTRTPRRTKPRSRT
jgi:CO/xanthine dehydrogenase FAD-binding subunit